MHILITGVTGFAGGHLAEALLTQPGVTLWGTSRGAWPKALGHLASSVTLLRCDLGDAGSVDRLIREVGPQQIYHLAGYAHAGQSVKEPDAAWNGNLIATRQLYDALQRWGGKTRVLYVGSGLVYGDPDSPDQAQHEECPFRPASPYATSKAAADLLSYQVTRTAGLDVVRARPFNHIGPRQSPEYAVAHFAKQIAAIEGGGIPPILQTGNLSPRRDLTDVRDVVRAYQLLMEKGRTGEAYNVGTGESRSMQEIVDRLRRLARVPVELRQQAALTRATETYVVRADAQKLFRETGWKPRTTLEQTLTGILEFWRHSDAGEQH